ncbi:MAG: alpha/beta hydrolase fold domain-containing protein [Paracoccaceae bacterium]
MSGYDRLIDAETWAFIRETERWYPPDAVAASIAEQRCVYDAMCRAFFAGYPADIIVSDHDADGVPIRQYRKTGAGEAPLVLYFHGGGFVVGGLASHDDICAEICDATGHDVISVDYRLSPEHYHPAAFDDCMTALAWVRGTLERGVILVGDSAGGNLAAALAHASRKTGILGQVLIYPDLGGDRDKGSYLTHANAPMLTRGDLLFYEGIRTGAQAPTADPTFAPLHATDFNDLPATIAIAAECDPLADDASDYAKRIMTAGGQAFAITEPGLVHGYLRARHSAARARASFARITRAIAILGENRMPTAAELAD